MLSGVMNLSVFSASDDYDTVVSVILVTSLGKHFLGLKAPYFKA
jgi:hypothetical protein